MNTEAYRRIVLSQFEASLTMLKECLEACPAGKWTGKVGRYAFWHVAYHALSCTDLYAATSEARWKTNPRFHPGGLADVEGEYPTRLMTKPELLDYVAHVRRKVRASLRRETTASLKGPAGFGWLPFARAEVPLYSTAFGTCSTTSDSSARSCAERRSRHDGARTATAADRVGVRWFQAEKLDPQPQELVAFGLLKTKPRPMISSLKSITVPLR